MSRSLLCLSNGKLILFLVWVQKPSRFKYESYYDISILESEVKKGLELFSSYDNDERILLQDILDRKNILGFFLIKQRYNQALVDNEIDLSQIDFRIDPENTLILDLKGTLNNAKEVYKQRCYAKVERNIVKSLTRFYKEDMRNITLRSGGTLINYKCDSDFLDTIDDWQMFIESSATLDELKEKRGVYTLYYDGSIINFSQTDLERLKKIVIQRRKLCGVNYNVHLQNIARMRESEKYDIQNLENYNYKVDIATQQEILPLDEFTLN